MVKHRQLAPTVGPLANDRQKNSMTPLDDNLVLENGTSFRIDHWIFIADGSGGFESRSINQDLPEVPKVAKHHELATSSTNSKKSDSRMKPEFNPNST